MQKSSNGMSKNAPNLYCIKKLIGYDLNKIKFTIKHTIRKYFRKTFLWLKSYLILTIKFNKIKETSVAVKNLKKTKNNNYN